MERYCISCDWLQTFCHGERLHQSLESCRYVVNGVGQYRVSAGDYVFYIKPIDIFTPIYLDVYYVYCDAIKVAEICQNPRVPQMHVQSTSVRLDNRVLYHEGYISMLYALQEACHLHYKGITRLDICYDCNWLHNHRSPRKFVRDLLIVPAGKVGHIYRRGARKGMCNFDRSPVGETYFSSISWGSYKADYSCKIYNKSQEMAEVKRKPWVEECWKIAGLKHNIKDSWWDIEAGRRKKLAEGGATLNYIDDEVWRFEVSIKSHGTDILDMSTGLLFRLSPKFIDNQERLEFLFSQWSKKAFDFRICEGQKNYRHYPSLQVFEVADEITHKPIHLSNKVGSGRTERMVANKLAQLKLLYSESDTAMATTIEETELKYRERADLKDSYVQLLGEIFDRYNMPHLPTNEDYKEMIVGMLEILRGQPAVSTQIVEHPAPQGRRKHEY